MPSFGQIAHRFTGLATACPGSHYPLDAKRQDIMSIALAILALLLGGVMKGATGAGAPVIATPALTMLFDVQTAVAILVVPNLLSNIWQAWSFRSHALPPRFLIMFAGGGIFGAVLGTWLLVVLAPETLALMVAFAVIAYIALRLAKPGWVLPANKAEGLSAPVGLLGGFCKVPLAFLRPCPSHS